MRCTSCGGATEQETCDACVERELGFMEGRRRQKLAWLYTCAHRAVKLARVYRSEDGEKSLRARGCMAQLKVYRRDIRSLRTTPAMSLPGVMKARPSHQQPAQKSRAS
jgi:hypothetical protein